MSLPLFVKRHCGARFIHFLHACRHVRKEKEREPRRGRHARRSARFLLGTSRIIREPGEHIVSGGQMPPSRRLRVESKHRRQKGHLARKGRCRRFYRRPVSSQSRATRKTTRALPLQRWPYCAYVSVWNVYFGDRSNARAQLFFNYFTRYTAHAYTL